MFQSTKHAAKFKLIKFLRDRQCDAEHATHGYKYATHLVDKTECPAMWHISDKDNAQFLKLYAEAAKYFPIDIEETLEATKPLLIHMQYDQAEYSVKDIVKGIINLLSDRFGSDNDFTCVVFGRRPASQTEMVYVHFPYVVCDDIHHKMIRNILNSFRIRSYWVFEDVWLTRTMYLSSEDDRRELFKIYNNKALRKFCNAKPHDFGYEMTKLLSMRCKQHLLVRPLLGHDFFSYPMTGKVLHKDLPKISYDRKTIITLIRIIKGQNNARNTGECRNIIRILYYCDVTNTNPKIGFKSIANSFGRRNREELWKYYADNFKEYPLTYKNLFYYAHIWNPLVFEEKVATDPHFKSKLEESKRF